MTPKQRVLKLYPNSYATELPISGGWRAATDLPNRRRYTGDGDTARLAWAELAAVIFNDYQKPG